MNAAHTEHCGSMRIADETLGDTLYAVKNNSGWNEPDDIPPQYILYVSSYAIATHQHGIPRAAFKVADRGLTHSHWLTA